MRVYYRTAAIVKLRMEYHSIAVLDRKEIPIYWIVEIYLLAREGLLDALSKFETNNIG